MSHCLAIAEASFVAVVNAPDLEVMAVAGWLTRCSRLAWEILAR